LFELLDVSIGGVVWCKRPQVKQGLRPLKPSRGAEELAGFRDLETGKLGRLKVGRRPVGRLAGNPKRIWIADKSVFSKSL
jgi:hypothetical protein